MSERIKDKWLLYSLFALFALGLTLALFILIQALIKADGSPLANRARPMVDFIPLKREQTEESRSKPARPQQKETEPLLQPSKPHFDVPRSPPLEKNFSIDTQPTLMSPALAAQVDGDILPLMRIAPQYPMSAIHRGVEGWVLVEFTISKSGFVLAPKVVRAQPPSLFDRAALRAVRQWRYKPQVINGKAQERRGVRTLIQFELEK